MIGQRGGTKSARVTRYRDGSVSSRKDTLAVEEPLEIRVSWMDGDARRVEALAVTMRTPGNDFELVAGFLHAEGVSRGADDLLELTYCQGPEEQEYNVVEARLAPGVDFDLDLVRRNVYTTSSCGVCGKASLEAVEAAGCVLLAEGLTIEGALIPELPDRLLEGQGVFSRTGGLHAAGLFDATGARLLVMEDVGRHNAVDKVIGHELLGRRLPANDRVLVVSGRASFELVQKSIAAEIPVLIAVGAPSSLAVDLARRFRQTLVGFARNGGFNVYTEPDRVQ
jgi:FdhD protein